jgi:hypothetical protein
LEPLTGEAYQHESEIPSRDDAKLTHASKKITVCIFKDLQHQQPFSLTIDGAGFGMANLKPKFTLLAVGQRHESIRRPPDDAA